jgi:hypothetical protein
MREHDVPAQEIGELRVPVSVEPVHSVGNRVLAEARCLGLLPRGFRAPHGREQVHGVYAQASRNPGDRRKGRVRAARFDALEEHRVKLGPVRDLLLR